MVTCDVSSRRCGFAYLWMLVYVALMCVSLALAGEIYATSIRRDQEEQLLSIGRQFQFALTSYRNSTAPGESPYPKSMEDLLEDRRGPIVRRHLRKIFFDPIADQANWGEVREGGYIVGIYSSSRAQPLVRKSVIFEYKEFEFSKTFHDWVFRAQN